MPFGHCTVWFIYYAAKILHFDIVNTVKTTPKSVISRKDHRYGVHSEDNTGEKEVTWNKQNCTRNMDGR